MYCHCDIDVLEERTYKAKETPEQVMNLMEWIWCDRNCHPDVIPVDVVCNGLIVVAWKTGQDTRRPGETSVYNLGLLEMEPITYSDVMHQSLKHISSTSPFSSVFWFPTAALHSNFYVYTALTICLQWIPAYLVDAILFLLGSKTFMVRVQRKILYGVNGLKDFNRSEWNFSKNNILRVREELSEKDREIFKLTNEGLKLDEYLSNALRLSRWYLLKDDLANIPTARYRMKILYVLHCFVKLLSYLLVGRIPLQLALKLCRAFIH